MGLGLGLRGKLERAARFPPLRRLLTRAQLSYADRAGARRHPLDRAYGIHTQAPLPLYLNHTGTAADVHMVPYAGCVPSVLRQVLDGVPGLDGATFLDIGCGKGRALVVASERPFARIIGMELNLDLVRVARRNAARLRLRHRDRTAIEVRHADASRPDVPPGDLVVFMYHPFGEPLVWTLGAHLAGRADGDIHLIYENPVHGAVFDADPRYERWMSATLDHAPDEVGYGFDTCESVVVWRLRRKGHTVSPYPRDAAIVIAKAGFRATLG